MGEQIFVRMLSPVLPSGPGHSDAQTIARKPSIILQGSVWGCQDDGQSRAGPCGRGLGREKGKADACGQGLGVPAFTNRSLKNYLRWQCCVKNGLGCEPSQNAHLQQ